MRKRISKTVVDSTDPPASGEVTVWDTELPGFLLRVRSTGSKSYAVQYGAGRAGRSRKVALGHHGQPAPPDPATGQPRTWTAEVARLEARRVLGLVAAGLAMEAIGYLAGSGAGSRAWMVAIGGVLFGLFAGINYWFPKAFGFKLDPFWGKLSFWFWVSGFYFAFMPLYVLGLMGVTRRLRVFDDPSLQIWFVIAAFGAFLILLGIGAMLVQFAVSILRREQLKDTTGDPWNARTLEWATSSPPPDYNFAFTPVVYDNDAWWDM